MKDPEGWRTKDAWCYGNFGVAHSLALAGDALDRPDLDDLAERTLVGASARMIDGSRESGWGLCHGLGGAVAVLSRWCGGDRDPAIARNRDRLAAELAAESTKAAFSAGIEGVGLLDGTTGVALALLSAAGHQGWNRSLVLS